MAGLIAIGLGCRASASSEAIAALAREALTKMGARLGEEVLFTSEHKRGEANIEGAAAMLGLPLRYLPHADLLVQAPRAATRSARVERHVGLPSLAETAALAGAGEGGVLIVTRLAAGGATCAIAYREGNEP